MHLPFTYPPLAAAIFSSFTVVPLSVATVIFTAISLACMWFLVITGATRTIPLSDPRTIEKVRYLLLGALIVAPWCGPIVHTLSLGQINLILYTLIVADVVAAISGKRWAGVLTGLAAAIKLTPLAFLLFFLLQLDWPGCIRMVGSFLVFTGIGFLIAPSDSVTFWTEAISDPGRVGGVAFAANQSINGELFRLGLTDSGLKITWFALSLISAALISWAGFRAIKAGHQLIAAELVGIAALLASPISWDHHWILGVLLVISAAVLWLSHATQANTWLTISITGFLIFMISPQRFLPKEHDVELTWNLGQHLLGNLYLLWAYAAVVAIGLIATNLGHQQSRSGIA